MEALSAWALVLSVFFFMGTLRVLLGGDRIRENSGQFRRRRTLSTAAVAESGECRRAGDIQLQSVSLATFPQHGSSTVAAATGASFSHPPAGRMPQVTGSRSTPVTGPPFFPYPSALQQTYQPAQ